MAQFSSIYGIDFDSADNLCVADGTRIRRITLDGVVNTTATAPFAFGNTFIAAPTAANLAVSSDGTAYVNRGASGFGFWRSTPEGGFELLTALFPPSEFLANYCNSRPTPEQTVLGPARRGPDGLIYIANGSCLSRLTPTGRLELLGGSVTPGLDAAAASGQVGPLSTARFNRLNALAFDSAGRAYLADSATSGFAE